jgi:hypothetical protein
LPKPDDFYVKDPAYILMRTRPDTDRSQCVKQTNVIITSTYHGKTFGGRSEGSADTCLRLKAGFLVNGKAFKGQGKVMLIPV